MKIQHGPMLFEIHGLPTADDVEEEFSKLKELLIGRRLTPALQTYIFDELCHALSNKIKLSSTRVQ